MRNKKRKTKKIRVTLDLSQEFYNRLEKLEDLLGADSKARLIRDALQVYEFIAHSTIEGDGFKLISKDGTESNIVILGTTNKL